MKDPSLTHRAVFDTSWGKAGLAWTQRGVCKLVLPGLGKWEIMESISAEYSMSVRRDPTDEVQNVIEQVRAYFDGEAVKFRVRLDLGWAHGFQHSVYEALMRIPRGEKRSYTEVAKDAGSPGAQRAVGNANAKNRIPLIIPCHRVIMSDGSLGGFSGVGGTDMKQRLLDHERNELQGTNNRLKKSNNKADRKGTGE